jgi:hypothetical protein
MLLARSAAMAGDLVPARLLCEYAEHPLAVDCARPRLSWINEPKSEKRGLRQSAYQVLVASTAEELARDHGDLWDSGRVESEDSIQVQYAGRPLASRQQCVWKVRTWDQDGQMSSWSQPAGWAMGLLAAGDWQAQWIEAKQEETAVLHDCNWYWHGQPGLGAAYPPGKRYFRRSLNLPPEAKVIEARFTFAADNRGTLFVNGKRIVEATTWQSAVTADLTSVLKPGSNVLAIVAENTTQTPNPAGVMGKLMIRLEDGRQRVMRIDEQWKSSDKAQAGWEGLGFNDSAWPSAVLVRKFGQPPWTDAPASIAGSHMPIFRRAFEVAKPVRRAMLYASGLGQHEVWLNGLKVGAAVIEPSWSNYRKTCYYRASDVTAMLRQGENAIGVLVGNGMYNVVGGRYAKFIGSFGPLKLMCQLEIEHADGSRTVVGSDGSWKWTNGPIRFSCTFGGEDYDAREELPEWDRPGFNAAAWPTAHETSGPGGQRRSEIVEPIQAMIKYKPVKVTQVEDGVWVYDLGQNFSGWPVIRVRGPAGANVKLTPGELLDERGRVSQRSSGGPMWFGYTLKGVGLEQWQPRFTYYGFRYVQVEGAAPKEATGLPDATPRIEELVGEFIHTATRTCGQFECSNELVNRIHWLINAAILSNFKSVLTDCPHREKLGWLEVSHLLASSILYNYDGARFYEKICRDMREAQLDTGMVPDIAPEFTVFSGGFRDSPEWGSACVVNPWVLWETYGDRRALEENYDTMKRYTDYLASKADGNGIVAYGLGDWCDVGPKGPGPSQLTALGLTSTAMLFNNLVILERTARVLGRPAEAGAFGRRAAGVRQAFQRAFFNADRSNYDRNSQAANAIPLALGLAEPNRRAAVLENLVQDIRANKNRVTAGDVGFVYLVRTLADNGRGNVLYDMLVQDEGPGYVYQLKKNATSLVETWDANPATSQNHCMLGHAEEWLYRGLGGIRLDPASPAFKRFILRPDVPRDLEWVKASYDSIHGRISSQWRQTPDREGSRFTWTVTIPPNTSATVFVPARDLASVHEGSRPASQSPGLKLLRMEHPFAVLEAASGIYQFESEVSGVTGL